MKYNFACGKMLMKNLSQAESSSSKNRSNLLEGETENRRKKNSQRIIQKAVEHSRAAENDETDIACIFIST